MLNFRNKTNFIKSPHPESQSLFFLFCNKFLFCNNLQGMKFKKVKETISTFISHFSHLKLKEVKKTVSTQKRFFQNLSSLLLLSGLSLFLISCEGFPGLKGQQERARVLVDEEPRSLDSENNEREEKERNSRPSCSESDTRSDVISLIGDLDFVDTVNVGNYELRGRCETSKRAVSIKVNGYNISENPSCSRGRWELQLDLSSIASEGKEIVFEISHNDESFCKKVLVGFLGPKNYIPVPFREDYYESSFYVMKYEAKLENGRSSSAKAVSKPEDSPISRVSYDDALKLCRNNGPRYDLIKNSQWQNIALAIEETNINWSRGRRSLSDDNSLNCGVILGRARSASSDDRDDCADSTCSSQWDIKRRTHILSNGEIIWDICGNVGEIMKDKYTLDESFEGYVFEMSGRLKSLFGPGRTYKTGTENNRRSRQNLYWGLGKAEIEADHDLIVRGSNSRTGSGIFSVSVTEDHVSQRTLNQIGFRCVYLP